MRDYEREAIEKEIVNYLNNGRKVYIECGCLNDEIIEYSIIKSKSMHGKSMKTLHITLKQLTLYSL